MNPLFTLYLSDSKVIYCGNEDLTETLSTSHRRRTKDEIRSKSRSRCLTTVGEETRVVQADARVDVLEEVSWVGVRRSEQGTQSKTRRQWTRSVPSTTKHNGKSFVFILV